MLARGLAIPLFWSGSSIRFPPDWVARRIRARKLAQNDGCPELSLPELTSGASASTRSTPEDLAEYVVACTARLQRSIQSRILAYRNQRLAEITPFEHRPKRLGCRFEVHP